MSLLRIMVGVPGSGKSTYAKNMRANTDSVYISRDDIRFSMVKEDEPYFSKEDAVFAEFTKQISDALAQDQTVWADATHVNKNGRLKLLQSLSVEPDAIEIIFMNTSLEQCIAQNEKRAGTRSYVPVDVIKRMHKNLVFPSYQEGGYLYRMIWMKTPDTVITIVPKEEDDE